MPMTRGGTPALAIATTRASGSSPCARAAASEATISAQAPSLSPDALPAVTVPPSRNGAGSDASFASVVSGRGCSSRSTMRGAPRGPGTSTGTISTARRPASSAAAARCCERSAKASWSARAIRCSAATFSAVSAIESIPWSAAIRGLTKRQPRVVSCSSAARENALGALPSTNGARLMLSTPPAIRRSASPALIVLAAWPTASMPEPHSRLTVAPGTLVGRPASSAAMRATFRLSSPAWLAQPMSTSSTAAGSSPGWRSSSARIGNAARSSARTADRALPTW